MNSLLFVALLGVGLVCLTLADERKRYDRYQVIQIVPRTKEEVVFLHKLMIEDDQLDFFSEPSQVGKTVEILVPPIHYRRLQVLLRKENVNYDVTISNYQSVLDPMWREIDQRRSARGGQVFDLNNFNTIDDINDWMSNTLLPQCRTGFQCQIYSIGNTAQGRPINVFHMAKAGPGRKAIWIDGGIHAREWISPATVLYVLNTIVTGGNAAAVRLTDTYDWIVLPVMNVDGYVYTWTTDRNWRKNRRANPGSTCFGTDLNRNFDFRWGNDGVSFNPCSETFCGSGPASEPETQAVQAELVFRGPSLLAVITVHSYGNMWMFPWGNTVNFAGGACERSADHNELMRVSVLTANAIQATYGTQWSRGNSCEVIYATTGGTDDYAKGVAGVAYSFCPELRGNAFVIGANQIPLSFNEFWNGVVVMADAIAAAK